MNNKRTTAKFVDKKRKLEVKDEPQPVRIKVINLDRLVELRDKGLSLREMSAVLHITYSKIRRLLESVK